MVIYACSRSHWKRLLWPFLVSPTSSSVRRSSKYLRRACRRSPTLNSLSLSLCTTAGSWSHRKTHTFTFTFMHLADAFIQSDLHCIQVTVSTFDQLLLSLGIEPMILALLTPCSTSWATGKLFKLQFWISNTLIDIAIRGLHGLKTEARTRPVPEIVWPNPTRPERHG